MPAKHYWLMKTEPDVFSLDDLERAGQTAWEGVRNYQARNYLRDTMRVGDGVLIYHSNANPSGIAGLGKVLRAGYPDPTAFEPASEYYDPKSKPEAPTWYLVDVGFVERFPIFLPLPDLRGDKKLADMLLFQRSRLSIQPVTKGHYDYLCKLGRQQVQQVKAVAKPNP